MNDKGNILILAVVLVALIVATGLGYMGWSSHERWDTAFEKATVQAYFNAQAGIIERGLPYVKTRPTQDLPQGTVILSPGTLGKFGEYSNVQLKSVKRSSNVFAKVSTYDIHSTGIAYFYNHQLGNKNYGKKNYVSRDVVLRIRLRSFSNYLYLTDLENTIYDETIWFWGPARDTLNGRVHSNDFIGIKGRPVFLGPVSTCKDDFTRGAGYNPHFEYDPLFNTPPVFFPTTAQNARNNASQAFNDRDGTLMTRVRIEDATINVIQWPKGTPLDNDNIETNVSFPVPQNGAIFVDGEMELSGSLSGKLTIACSGDMWLIDDIKYSSTNDQNGIGNNDTQELLGLISEKNIIIKNTPGNGRENMSNGRSIIINAALVALNESFTFQQQNDDWDSYQGSTPDERGTIFLWGMVAQKRRGYVHRSNHNGTGYNKTYRYDFRLDKDSPPFFLDATDESGHGIFDMVSWTHVRPN